VEVEEFLKLHPDSDRAPDLRKILEELRGKAKKEDHSPSSDA